MNKTKISIVWFRRDLRLDDNHALFQGLTGEFPVLPLFIFDENILDELEVNDARVAFIWDQLSTLNGNLANNSSSFCIRKGNPLNVWKQLLDEFDISQVYTNEDYEPYAIERDLQIQSFLANHGIPFHQFKDHVQFAKNEVLKSDGTPYTVYTPFKNKWLEKLKNTSIAHYPSETRSNYLNINLHFPSLEEIGFEESKIKVIDYSLDDLNRYEEVRNIPSINQTSHLSPHLRFGTVSIRKMIKQALPYTSFLHELIWREFFIQILHHFPKVVQSNFKEKYDLIQWRNNEDEFIKWTLGQTGYPMVDAGMRELNATGYMHNRVRMITAGFLCKHLLIDWRWGEAYFASKLLDYELASNNGNWQWAAGTGCDAAPYFRVFNPSEQVRKFDPKLEYIRKWIPELDSFEYPSPIVDHKFARERSIKVYQEGINKFIS